MIFLRRVDKINITIVEIKRKVYTIDYCKENQFMDAYKIGKLIAKKRKELHLTQQALADQLSVTNKAISKWERGQGVPDISLLKDLAHILGITVDELLEGEQEEVISQSEDVIYHFTVTKQCYKRYLQDRYYQKRYQRGLGYLVAGMLIALGIALYQAHFYLRNHVDIIGLFILISGIVLGLGKYVYYVFQYKTFHEHEVTYSMYKDGILYNSSQKEVFYYFNQFNEVYVYEDYFVLKVGKELLWLEKQVYKFIEVRTHMHQCIVTKNQKVLWKIVLMSAYVFLLDFAVLLGYKVVLQRIGFEMIFDGMEIVLWLLLVICAGIIFIIYRYPLSLKKLLYVVGVSCIVLGVIFYIGQQFSNQRTIFSLSPNLSKQLVLKQDKGQGKLSYYHYTYFLFAKETDQILCDTHTQIDTHWITNDCNMITYQEQGIEKVYIATFGSRGNDISYYNVLPSMSGNWTNKHDGDPQYRMSIQTGEICIQYKDTKEKLKPEYATQNGTIAVTLYDELKTPRYVLVMNENCELNEDYLLKNTGTIQLIDVQRNIEVEMFCTTYKEDMQVQEQIDDEMKKQALEIVENMQEELAKDATLSHFDSTYDMFAITTTSTDFMEVVRLAYQKDIGFNQGLDGYKSIDQVTNICVKAGTIKDFYVEVEADTNLIHKSTGKENKGGYIMNYRIMQGDGCYLVSRITYRVPGDIGLSSLEIPIEEDVSQDKSYYFVRDY